MPALPDNFHTGACLSRESSLAHGIQGVDLHADQPEIFLQKVLKQTQPYLEGRGAKAAEKARLGRQAADLQAAESVKHIESSQTEDRKFDL